MIEAEGYETKGKYVVGCNMPGYLPDTDPSFFSNYRDALEAFKYGTELAIGDEIERISNLEEGANCDYIDRKDAALVKEWKRITRNANKRVERSMQIGAYRYWLEFAA